MILKTTTKKKGISKEKIKEKLLVFMFYLSYLTGSDCGPAIAQHEPTELSEILKQLQANGPIDFYLDNCTLTFGQESFPN
jgi:hypothetical protein